MRNFNYQTLEERENLEAILKRRKRKFNRQQITASIITAVIIGVLALYFAFHMYYTEYDGYIHVDANQVRTPFDIYLDSVYVKEGQIVAPGDTLYSYFNIEQLVEHFNINTEPAVISRYRDLTLQISGLQEQIAVVRARIKELQAQIKVEDHNISFGLSSNSHKLDLERELNVARAQLQALLQQLGLVNNLRNDSQSQYSKSSSVYGNIRNHGQQIFDDANSALLFETKSFHLASDSSIISDISAPDRMVFFEKEEIMTTQHIDLEGNNLMVVAYIPIDAMHRITRHSSAEIVVNSDFSFEAHVSVLGLRTEVIPDNLRSYFSKRNTAVIALLTIDPDQMVPFWTMTDGIPVSVRVRNFDTWGEKPSGRNYLWYRTGHGLQANLPDDWVYPGIKNDSTETVDTARMKADSIRAEKARRAVAKRDSIRAAKAAANAQASETETKQEPKAPGKAEPKVEPKQETKPATKAPEQAESSKAATSTAASSEYYYVVVASLNTEAGATKTADVFLKKYPHAGYIKSGKIYSVYLDRFTNKADADRFLSEIRKEKHFGDAYLKKGGTNDN